MVIFWSNDDGSTTVSQRQASDHSMPLVTNPHRVAVVSQANTYSNASGTRYTFTVPALNTWNTGPTDLIWAFSHIHPGSSSASSPLTQHDASGTMLLDLTADLDAASTTSRGRPRPTGVGYPTGGATGDTAGSGLASRDRQSVLLAHAVCGALATMLFLPTGVLVPRIARGLTTKRWWFAVHAAVNGVVAMVLSVAAYGIARGRLHRPGASASVHRNLGVVLLILVLLQVVLGIVTHWFKPQRHRHQTESGRGPLNFLHMGAGCLIVILGWVQVWTGMMDEWPTYSGHGDPQKIYIAGWSVIVAVVLLLYIFGLAFFLPRQLKLERQSRRRVTPLRPSAMMENMAREAGGGGKPNGEIVEMEYTRRLVE